MCNELTARARAPREDESENAAGDDDAIKESWLENEQRKEKKKKTHSHTHLSRQPSQRRMDHKTWHKGRTPGHRSSRTNPSSIVPTWFPEDPALDAEDDYLVPLRTLVEALGIECDLGLCTRFVYSVCLPKMRHFGFGLVDPNRTKSEQKKIVPGKSLDPC